MGLDPAKLGAEQSPQWKQGRPAVTVLQRQATEATPEMDPVT